MFHLNARPETCVCRCMSKWHVHGRGPLAPHSRLPQHGRWHTVVFTPCNQSESGKVSGWSGWPCRHFRRNISHWKRASGRCSVKSGRLCINYLLNHVITCHRLRRSKICQHRRWCRTGHANLLSLSWKQKSQYTLCTYIMYDSFITYNQNVFKQLQLPHPSKRKNEETPCHPVRHTIYCHK